MVFFKFANIGIGILLTKCGQIIRAETIIPLTITYIKFYGSYLNHTHIYIYGSCLKHALTYIFVAGPMSLRCSHFSASLFIKSFNLTLFQ